MSYETVLYEKSENVATVTLNRPEALNAFDGRMMAEVVLALKEADGDADVRCIVLAAAGRVFSAGADVKGWNRDKVQQRAEAEAPSPLVVAKAPREPILDAIMDSNKPIIAAVNGAAVGMGATITTACDLRTASESARFGFVFVKRGVTPELGSSFFLPRLVGLGRAREICYTGRFVGAKEAREIGLVNEVYPDDKLMSGTLELARSIAANAPLAVRFAKHGLSMGLDASLRDVVRYEQWAIETCWKSEDFKEAITAFLEKREPKFRAR